MVRVKRPSPQLVDRRLVRGGSSAGRKMRDDAGKWREVYGIGEVSRESGGKKSRHHATWTVRSADTR